MRLIAGLLILTVYLSCYIANGAYCNGRPHTNVDNDKPIWDSDPRFIASVKNGKLFEIGDPKWNNTMHIVHLWGTNYQRGEAQGQLLRNQLQEFIHSLYAYIEDQIKDALPSWMPNWLQQRVAAFGLGTALDMTYYATKPFTTKDYYEQMRGLSKASGVHFKFIRRIHMIGEITKGHCSMFGVWGQASYKGQTIQLRALDWDFDGPYRKVPAVIVYHPEKTHQGNTFANIGFMGWLGSITGISEKRLAISEIGVSYPDDTFGQESRIGNPFTFILRDILQFDNSLDDSIHRLKNARRTCNLILGVGDGNQQSFRAFQYGHSVCNVIDDANLLPVNSTWHPQIENAVYFGMDWLCPPFHQKLAELIQENYGNIDAELTVRQIMPHLTSGNLQIAVYDLTNLHVYIAYGYQNDGTTINAYDQAFVKLDLNQIFKEPKPEL